jgi:hypothetical protein
MRTLKRIAAASLRLKSLDLKPCVPFVGQVAIYAIVEVAAGHGKQSLTILKLMFSTIKGSQAHSSIIPTLGNSDPWDRRGCRRDPTSLQRP